MASPELQERALQTLAGTDLRSSLAYEARVQAFHAALREFYYPKLFRDEPFEPAALEALPLFAAQAADDWGRRLIHSTVRRGSLAGQRNLQL